MLKLEKGRPADCAGRLEKEVRTYDFLDKLNIEYERIDHEAAMTMEECADDRRSARRNDLQESVPVQPAGDNILPADDTGR